MIKTFLTVTDRERDTILAALRHYQASTIIPDAIRDIANNDHDSPLDADEIDALCEDINCSASGPIRVLVATEGGTVQGAVADQPGVSVIVLDYDTEGADANRVFAIPQDGGGTAEAFVGGHSAVHDPAFIDGAEAAKLADPQAAIEQLRWQAERWGKQEGPHADAIRRQGEEAAKEADEIEAQLTSEATA